MVELPPHVQELQLQLIMSIRQGEVTGQDADEMGFCSYRNGWLSAGQIASIGEFR